MRALQTSLMVGLPVALVTPLLALLAAEAVRVWRAPRLIIALTGAELMFRRLGCMVFQIQMAKRWDGLPLTRDYITDWERAQTSQAVAAE